MGRWAEHPPKLHFQTAQERAIRCPQVGARMPSHRECGATDADSTYSAAAPASSGSRDQHREPLAPRPRGPSAEPAPEPG